MSTHNMFLWGKRKYQHLLVQKSVFLAHFSFSIAVPIYCNQNINTSATKVCCNNLFRSYIYFRINWICFLSKQTVLVKKYLNQSTNIEKKLGIKKKPAEVKCCNNSKYWNRKA